MKILNNLTIVSITEILNNIDNLDDAINLNNNIISKAELNLLPKNITKVFIDNNLLTEIYWDDRNWDIISIKKNNLSIDKFMDLKCKKLFLDDNNIDKITFINCNFEELSISNNNLKSIKFINCNVKELNISINKLSEISTLPNKLVKLNCFSNKINKISAEFEQTILWIDLSDNKLFSCDELPKFPNMLSYLDLSKNKFKTFNTDILTENLNYFDITENDIINNKKIFEILKSKVTNLYYDTDDNDSNSEILTDSSSDISLKFSNDMNFYFPNFNNQKATNIQEIDLEFEDLDTNYNINCLNDLDDSNDSNEYLHDSNEYIHDSNEYIHDSNEYIHDDVCTYKNNYQNTDINTNINTNMNMDYGDDLSTSNNINLKYGEQLKNFLNKMNEENDQKLDSKIINLNHSHINRQLFLESAIKRFQNINNPQEINNYSPMIPVKLHWNFNL